MQLSKQPAWAAEILCAKEQASPCSFQTDWMMLNNASNQCGANSSRVNNIVGKEGEPFYAQPGEDEVSVLDVNEQEYCDILSENDVNESDFIQF